MTSTATHLTTSQCLFQTSMVATVISYVLSLSFLASRKDEVSSIRSKFPNKVPVIVERYHKEKDLPILDKTKFLVPEELTLSQFVTIIRYRPLLVN